jgi:hypothetical protein
MSETSESKTRASWGYSGEVWTDANGRAVIVLPPFVRSHRGGFDYELMPARAGCAATVTDEIVDDRFAIASDQPHMKVAWRVTPLREANTSSGSAKEERL